MGPERAQSDGEKWLQEQKEIVRQKERRFLRALAIWIATIVTPAMLIWLFAVSPRAAETMGEWYFVWVLGTGFLIVPALERWMD